MQKLAKIPHHGPRKLQIEKMNDFITAKNMFIATLDPYLVTSHAKFAHKGKKNNTMNNDAMENPASPAPSKMSGTSSKRNREEAESNEPQAAKKTIIAAEGEGKKDGAEELGVVTEDETEMEEHKLEEIAETEAPVEDDVAVKQGNESDTALKSDLGSEREKSVPIPGGESVETVGGTPIYSPKKGDRIIISGTKTVIIPDTGGKKGEKRVRDSEKPSGSGGPQKEVAEYYQLSPAKTGKSLTMHRNLGGERTGWELEESWEEERRNLDRSLHVERLISCGRITVCVATEKFDACLHAVIAGMTEGESLLEDGSDSRALMCRLAFIRYMNEWVDCEEVREELTILKLMEGGTDMIDAKATVQMLAVVSKRVKKMSLSAEMYARSIGRLTIVPGTEGENKPLTKFTLELNHEIENAKKLAHVINDLSFLMNKLDLRNIERAP